MHRRTFTSLPVAAIAWPLVGRAQSATLPVVGIFVAGVPDPTLFLKEFEEGLRSLGYVDRQNIVLELRSAGGTAPERLKKTALELVGLKPAVLVCFQTPTAEAAKAVTDKIPIVMAGVGDAVGTGLVESLARPGGNVTGISAATAETAAKNVQILSELLPAARRVAAVCNVNDPFSRPFLEKIQAAGSVIGVDIRTASAHGAAELETVFAAIAKESIDAAVVQPSLGTDRPAALALKYRLAAASPNALFAEAGGLLAYCANQPAHFRTAAVFTDKILKGTRPADLPVQEPSRFDLIVNMKTATTLGIAVSPALLARADQVIE